jgi:hypothetical protein
MKLARVYLFVLIILNISCVSTRSKINVTGISRSLISEDHTSEGFLITLSNGKILHFFRLDPGFEGSHIGNSSKIVVRESSDNALSWTKPRIIYDSAFDDRNVRGGITKDSTILLFFREFDADKKISISKKYLKSKDDGITWSTHGIDSIGLCDTCSYTDYFIEIYNNYYMLSQTIINYVELIFFSENEKEIVWHKKKVILDYIDSLHIDEPRFAKLKKGNIIGLFRDEGGSNYYQAISRNYGETWTIPVKTNLNDGLFSPNPEIFYDKDHYFIFVVGTDRNPHYDKNSIWIYANKPNEIFLNSFNYTLIKKILDLIQITLDYMDIQLVLK